MTDITYTQQFYLCAVNSKGKFPWGNEAASRCLLAGATLELLDSGVITLDVEGTLGVACAWGDWTVSRPLGGAAAYEVLTDVAVEPAATGEPGAYLQPLYDTIAGFAKPTGLDGLAQVYLYGLDTDPQALLVQYIGASLWEMECADAVPGDNPAKQRYAPRGDATLTVVGKIRAEVLEADAPAVGPLTLAYLLNRAGIARDCVGKPDAARLKASEPPVLPW